MTPLETVRSELARYRHRLLDFDAEERADGAIELLIRLRAAVAGAHTYRAPIHPRDIENPQFAWTFQGFLYDCVHDYMVELFQHTPQSLDAPR